MTIKEMHYDFKQKLNEIDSQRYRNLKVPEIDWKLNEAIEVFVKMIAQPRLKSQYGFESNQRTIDNIRTIVIDQVKGSGIVPTVYDTVSYIAALPTDYWFYLNSRAYATKGGCTEVKLVPKEIQHDDESDESPFDRSSFEWRVTNIRFNSQGIRMFTGGGFSITELVMSYLKRPQLVYNAADWPGGTYNMLDGTVLTGTQDCDLPIGVHGEVVDLAVLITSKDLNLPTQAAKEFKIKLTQ